MPPAPPKPKEAEPDFAAHQEDLLRRLSYAQAGAAQDYQEGRDGLAAYHGKMDARAAALQAKIDRLSPRVERLLTKPGTPLDPKLAQDCLQYLRLCAELHEVLTARRYAFGATQPAKTPWEPGQPIGDPPAGTPDAQIEN